MTPIAVGAGIATSLGGGSAWAQSAIRAPIPPNVRTQIQAQAPQNPAVRGRDTAALTPGMPDSFGTDWSLSGARDTAMLPRPLSDRDAGLYAQIFAVQKSGDWGRADALIASLEDRLLMGHVLYQRLMHPTAYRSRYRELKDWMAHYADHPGADRIYRLALKRRPSNWKYPIEPQRALPAELATLSDGQESADKRTGKALKPKKEARSRAQRSEIRQVQRSVRRWVQRGSVTKSLDYLSQRRFQRLLDPVSYAESLGVIARGYFRYHKDAEAIAAAEDALKRAGETATNAAWWGGLAAFRADRFDQAARFFSVLAQSPYAKGEDRAAGAYWASRAYLIGGQPQRVNGMLRQAAEHQRSFYGLLSIRALGLEPSFDWELPRLSRDQADLLRRIPAARRALALIQAGQQTRAESELRRFARHLPPSAAQMLLTMADRAGLADLSYRLGADLERRHGLKLDAALYPSPGWAPDGGFTIDRALVYALIRQESRFRPNAKSRAGARGLMQLMPATAGFVAKKRFRGAARDQLLDPGLNLKLGQDYLGILKSEPLAGQNLFYTMTAYNGGPGNLQKWLKKVDDTGDPLLFIESIPSRETRNYVEHVLANLWIYRHKMGQEAPSKDALLAGRWPIYIAQDGLGGDDARQIRQARATQAAQ
ncbi:MAG: lytic transglycosylase domain-containing protein [Alphaproteobacteria bacterium]|nr:lytic transglycosylase domain-containing protein [Alphaproteobacteria bacterium]